MKDKKTEKPSAAAKEKRRSAGKGGGRNVKRNSTKGDIATEAKKTNVGQNSKPNKTKKVHCTLPGAELLEQGLSPQEVMQELENGERKELKPEHERFCREYIIDDNATRAYQRAYPKSGYNTARAEGCRLQQNTAISARIEQLRNERNKRLEISADKVLRRLEARASVTPRDLYDEEGQFIPVHELHPDVAIGIKSIEVAELFAGSGENKQAIGLVRKITMVDGKASDELLGRNLKLWNDVGSKNNPLTLESLVAADEE